jgi:hypothetical protein
MNELEGRQINSGILWLLLGVFLIPTINGIGGLLNGLLKLTGLSITHRLITLIIYESVILLGLFVVIVLILRNGSTKYSKYFDLSFKRIKAYGLVCLITIIAGRVTSYFVLTDVTEEMKLLESEKMYDLLRESSYYHLTSVIMTATREVFLFIAFFAAVIKK